MTLAEGRRRRGEPLVVLALMGVSWIGVRIVLWEAPFEGNAARAEVVRYVPSRAATVIEGSPRAAPDEPALHGTTELAAAPVPVAVGKHRAAVGLAPASRAVPPFMITGRQQAVPAFPSSEKVASPGFLPRESRETVLTAPTAARRWRLDGWLAWRPGGGLPREANGAPLALAYGGSQGGLVARYDLGGRDRRLQAYVRVVHGPDRPAQSDLAVGGGLRPLPALPLRLQGEARVSRIGDETLVRPAALAVTELPVADLPLEFQAEAYAQAGWVGGRYSTGFADGQARVDRKLVATGDFDVRLGAGVWGGVQKYVSRLDVGPSLTVDLRDSGVPARVAFDYRKRVAGNARPGDGLVVTLSTGF